MTTDAAGRAVRSGRAVGAARTGTGPTPAPAPVLVGTFRTALRGWRVFVPVIVGYAVVQFLLVLPNLTPAPTPAFLSLVIAAFLLDMLLVAVTSVAASAAARGLTLRQVLEPRSGRRIVSLTGWSALWVAGIAFTAIVSAILSAIVILVGAAAMPAIVARRGFRGWFRPLRWLPLRTLVWGGGAYLILVLNAFTDTEFGFLVGNPLAAFCARIASGIIDVLILCSATVLAERAEARRAQVVAGRG